MKQISLLLCISIMPTLHAASENLETSPSIRTFEESERRELIKRVSRNGIGLCTTQFCCPEDAEAPFLTEAIDQLLPLGGSLDKTDDPIKKCCLGFYRSKRSVKGIWKEINILCTVPSSVFSASGFCAAACEGITLLSRTGHTWECYPQVDKATIIQDALGLLTCGSASLCLCLSCFGAKSICEKYECMEHCDEIILDTLINPDREKIKSIETPKPFEMRDI